ncbi:substrate-binding domain-containing protein [Microbulbifer sp.]|uniref:substrate-binding domain-containing protein n=1 Tax=Microbulbifer sp. TaxID=1908541 RepID=UPI003F30E30A
MPIGKIQITPAWTFSDDDGNRLDPQLFPLLRALHKQGKLTAATRQVGISYRHGWNLLNKWSAFFGHPLVELQKGRGASLTALGEKLLWAEQRVKARLGPQLENLASELNLALHQALTDINPVLRLHASHGYAVALLPEFAREFQLDLQYKSAVDALAALNRGACDIAGFHVPTEVISDTQMEAYGRYLKPRTQRILGFIERRQGLMVKADDPGSIRGIADLARPGVRFINRQKDSGTRSLLDELLRREGVPADRIAGYDDEEFTHSAVAAFVAAGMADVGFGVEAAARQFSLDFLPLTTERYLMVCHQRTLEQDAARLFLAMIRSAPFHQAVGKLPGYKSTHCGEILQMDTVLPWLARR